MACEISLCWCLVGLQDALSGMEVYAFCIKRHLIQLDMLHALGLKNAALQHFVPNSLALSNKSKQRQVSTISGFG